MKAGYVYIMASGRNGTLYIGVTSDLVKRVWEHRNGVVAGLRANTNANCSSGTQYMKTCRKLVTANSR